MGHLCLAVAVILLAFAPSHASAEALSPEGKQEFTLEFRNRFQDRLDERYSRLLSEPNPTLRLAKVDERLKTYEQDSPVLAKMGNGIVTPLFDGVSAYEKSFFADPTQYEDPSRAKLVAQNQVSMYTPAFLKSVPQASDCKNLEAKAKEARQAYLKGREKLSPDAAQFMDESCGKQLQALERVTGDCSIGKALTSDPTNFLGMAVGGGASLQLSNKNVAALTELARLGCNQARSMWREHNEMIKKATDLEAAVKAGIKPEKPMSKAVSAGAVKKTYSEGTINTPFDATKPKSSTAQE